MNLLVDIGFNREVAEDCALYWSKELGEFSRSIMLLVLNAIRYFEGSAMMVILSSNPSSRTVIASFATS